MQNVEEHMQTKEQKELAKRFNDQDSLAILNTLHWSSKKIAKVLKQFPAYTVPRLVKVVSLEKYKNQIVVQDETN